MDEMYPRECEFCTQGAALACGDSICREAGFGEPHLEGCPGETSRQREDCTCIPEGVDNP